MPPPMPSPTAVPMPVPAAPPMDRLPTTAELMRYMVAPPDTAMPPALAYSPGPATARLSLIVLSTTFVVLSAYTNSPPPRPMLPLLADSPDWLSRTVELLRFRIDPGPRYRWRRHCPERPYPRSP